MATPPASSPASQLPADDLQILRDCRMLYLKQLGQLLQEAEPVSARAVQAFQQTVGAYFDEMVSTGRRSSFEDAKGLTASRISLVGESDLELEIRLGEFSAHLMERTGGDLWRVYLRFVTLLDRPDLSTADNPVGPRGIALGLTDLCNELGEGHDQTLERIDRLEDYFAKNLTVLYASLNDFLAGNKVGAAQAAIVTASDSAGASGTPVNTPNPAALLQRQLLGPAGEAALPIAGPAAHLFSQAMLERLLTRLDELDKPARPTPVSNFSPTATSPSLETLIPGLFTAEPAPSATPQPLDSDRLGIPSGAPEAATIDAIARIFEAIFASPTLPDPIKSALASLQIPTLKAAMLDAAFFTTENHPARLLLDKMARAALGLAHEVSARHPLCVDIQAIASRARTEFRNDNQVFNARIGELNALIAGRDKAAELAAEAYLPLLYQLDRRKQAERRARQVIDGYLRPDVPASIVGFLHQHWLKVLVVNWMEGGEQSTDWQENLALIGNLLWSIEPKAEIDDRKRLAKMLPALLQRLNAGMARIGLPEETQGAFLDTCFALQTAAMRATGAPPPVPADQTPAIPAAAKPGVSELSAGHLLLKIIDLSGNQAEASRLRAAVRPGVWLSLTLNGKPPICGRLCQISPESGMLLLANPDWQFALAIHPNILEQMLKAGRAQLSSNESLFNSAAEQALRRTESA
ncbi:DUF1631 family protein [Dechloromonas denitrificans]|uniref:DUF1631 family protein n=1 Tax=Dechloromonas denitrificans TaxID=281362 RepID=UPI00082EF839|nr:DUF1631 family protein [Dechloromonas denitrificans]